MGGIIVTVTTRAQFYESIVYHSGWSMTGIAGLPIEVDQMPDVNHLKPRTKLDLFWNQFRFDYTTQLNS